MSPVPIRRTLVALTLALAVTAAGPAASAQAVVPPSDCGTIRVKAKRYNVKADQLRCTTAKRWTRTYLEKRRKPRGYTCRRYKNTKLVFRCNRGVRSFFAIRR